MTVTEWSGIADQLRQVADKLDRSSHPLAGGGPLGTLAVALRYVQDDLDRTPGALQDELPKEPEVTDRTRLLLLAANLGVPSNLQDICDAESLLGSAWPGGDAAVIREIETFTRQKWSRDRKVNAMKLATAYRESSAPGTALNSAPESESEIEIEPEKGHPIVVGDEPVAETTFDDVPSAREDAPTIITTAPIAPEPEAVSLATSDVVPTVKTPESAKEPTLAELRSNVLAGLIKQTGITREQAKDLLEASLVFTPNQIAEIEAMRYLIYNQRRDGTSDATIKAFCTKQDVSPDEMRRLALFFGIRLHSNDPTDRTKRTVALETPHPIGRIRQAAARNRRGGDPNNAERHLLRALQKFFVHADQKTK